MGQRGSNAAVKNVQTKLGKEDCAEGTAQSATQSYAAVMDAQVWLKIKECA